MQLGRAAAIDFTGQRVIVDRRLICSILIFVAGQFSLADDTCTISAKKKIIKSDRTQIHLQLTLTDSPELTKSSYPQTPKTVRLHHEIESNLPLRGPDLIKWQVPGYVSMPILQNRLNMVADSRVGEIRSAQCLENYLYSIFIEKFYVRDFPTEFQAYILSSVNETTNQKYFRIYFSSGDGRTWGYSPPTENLILNRLKADVAAGWVFEYHLHSHPFFYSKDVGYYMGLIVPSDADLNTYLGWFESLRMKEIRITNGIDTFILQPTQMSAIMATFPSEDSAAQGEAGALD